MKLIAGLILALFSAASSAAQSTAANSVVSVIAGSGIGMTAERRVPADLKVELPVEVPIDRDKTRMQPQTASGYARPDANKRFRRYLDSTVGPFALLGSGIAAGVLTAAYEPEEWGRSAKGYGRRFASNVGRNAIQNTVTYGLDEALKLDSHFYRSEKHGAGSRVSNALLSVVTARKPNGKRTIGAPRLIGTYTANVVAAETWFPERYSWKDGVRSGTVSLGVTAALNLFREFILK